MKKIAFILVLFFVFSACKDEKKEDTIVINDTIEVEKPVKSKEFPQTIAMVLKAHGGVDKWDKMNNLCFEMDGRDGTEVHTISLKNRHSKIETKDWTIGYDGKDVWLLENQKDAYKGNARFYHNLMFYFYAMPFVLSDDGIVYTNVAPTKLDGKMYNGIKISYNDGVGDSPKDEYILYYNVETNLMEWLGYTVTFNDNKKSEDWHFIKYDQWKEVNGLLIPEKLTWYNVKDGKPTDEKSDLKFDKITVTETVIEASVFEKPNDAVIVER
jgi:hypothetical protein